MKRFKKMLQKALLVLFDSPKIERWIFLLHNSKRKLIGGSVVIDIIAFISVIILQQSLQDTFIYSLIYAIAITVFIFLLMYLFLLNCLFNVKRSYLILIRKYLSKRLFEFSKEIIQRNLIEISYIGEIQDLEKIQRKLDIQLHEKNIRIKDLTEDSENLQEEEIIQVLDEGSTEDFMRLMKLKDGFKAKDDSVWWKKEMISLDDIVINLEKGGKILIEGEMGVGKSVLCNMIANRIVVNNLFKIRIEDCLPILINLNEHFAKTEEEMIRNNLPLKTENLKKEFAEKIVNFNNIYIFDGFNEYQDRTNLSNNTAHPFYLFQENIKNGVILTGRGYPLKEFRDTIKAKQEKTKILSKYSYYLLDVFSDTEVHSYINTIVVKRFSNIFTKAECEQKTNRFVDKLRKTFPVSYNIPIVVFVLTRDIEEFIEASNFNFLKKYYEILFSWYFGNKELITRSGINTNEDPTIYKFHTIREQREITFSEHNKYSIIPYHLFIYISTITYRVSFYQTLDGLCTIDTLVEILKETRDLMSIHHDSIDFETYEMIIEEVLKERNFIITKYLRNVENMEREIILIQPDKIREFLVLESISHVSEQDEYPEFYVYHLKKEDKERLIEEVLLHRDNLFDGFIELLKTFDEDTLEKLRVFYTNLSIIEPLDFLYLRNIRKESELSFIYILPCFSKVSILEITLNGLTNLDIKKLEKLEVLRIDSDEKIELEVSNLPNLEHLNLYECGILKLNLNNLPKLNSLVSYFFNPCEYCEHEYCDEMCYWLSETGYIDMMNIESFRLTMIDSIEQIELKDIPEIKNVIIQENRNLKKVILSDLLNLKKLKIEQNLFLEHIEITSSHKEAKIEKMVLWNNPSLREISDIENFFYVDELVFQGFLVSPEIKTKLRSSQRIKRILIQTSLFDFLTEQ